MLKTYLKEIYKIDRKSDAREESFYKPLAVLIENYGGGENKIEIIEYDKQKKLVKINSKQYFFPLSEEVWQYQIGGYQVMEKWLKDRKGRRLDLEDIKHFCKIATSLKETIAIRKKIDTRYEEIERDLIEA